MHPGETAPDLDVFHVLHSLALFLHGAGNDGNQFGSLPEGSHPAPAEIPLEGTGEILARAPGTSRPVLGKDRARNKEGLPPVGPHVPDVRMHLHDRLRPRGQCLEFLHIRSPKPHLQRVFLERARHDTHAVCFRIGKRLPHVRFDPKKQIPDLPIVLDLDKKLTVTRVGVLVPVGEDETECTLSYEGGDVPNSLESAHEALEFCHIAGCVFQMGSLGSPKIHVKKRLGSMRKEAQWDLSETDNRQNQEQENRRHRHNPMGQAEMHRATIDAEHGLGVRIRFVHVLGNGKVFHAEQGHHRHRKNPTQHKRESHDLKQGSAELAHSSRRKPDRAEGQDRHHRRAE